MRQGGRRKGTYAAGKKKRRRRAAGRKPKGREACGREEAEREACGREEEGREACSRGSVFKAKTERQGGMEARKVGRQACMKVGGWAGRKML